MIDLNNLIASQLKARYGVPMEEMRMKELSRLVRSIHPGGTQHMWAVVDILKEIYGPVFTDLFDSSNPCLIRRNNVERA